ncbi:MAG TPA: hypothetical protein VFW33_23235 [Gemmataceae bacterium]|nr:hypothetical protein [Gemmataceae bacterium]
MILHSFLRRPLGWVVALTCLSAPAARAQDRLEFVAPGTRPLVLHDINLWAATAEAPPVLSPTPRIRLPRMPATTLGDPLGLIDDGDPSPDPDAPLPPSSAGNDGLPIQVSMGNDNPFFDFRRRGAPGGVGYYKVQTQVTFLDTGRTGCTFSFQAVRPAGLESNGVNDGPTFVSPALTIFHDLGDGTALHGFVGKDVRANSTWRDGVVDGSNLKYGLALQQPVPGLTSDPSRGLFVFLEAQGYWTDRDQGTGRAWEVVPGLHYRLSDTWWMSGGVLVPVGPTRYGPAGQWHLSCSWQY